MDWSFGLNRRLSVIETHKRKEKKQYFCCCFRKKKKVRLEDGETIITPITEYNKNSMSSDDTILSRLIKVTE
jgi:hypothetical protein